MNKTQPAPWQVAFSERTGTVTEEDLFHRLPLVLARHGYLIEMQEQRGGSLYFETQWKTRYPAQDEHSANAHTSRTRLRFRAREQGMAYGLRIYVDHESLGSNRIWYAIEPDHNIKTNLEEIVFDLRSELSVRMRTF